MTYTNCKMCGEIAHDDELGCMLCGDHNDTHHDNTITFDMLRDDDDTTNEGSK